MMRGLIWSEGLKMYTCGELGRVFRRRTWIIIG